MLAAPVDFSDPFNPGLIESMRFWRVRLAVYPAHASDTDEQAARRFSTFVDDLNRIVRLYKVSQGDAVQPLSRDMDGGWMAAGWDVAAAAAHVARGPRGWSTANARAQNGNLPSASHL